MTGTDPDQDKDKDTAAHLDAAYALETPDDNRRLYADWADTYESGFIADSRYVYHEHVADIFVGGGAPAGGTDGPGPVLDVGCGTGIVGVALRARGIAVIDGVDISPEMLAKAGEKRNADGPVYRDLIEADLTGPIAIDTDRYGGVVSAGAFTHGHLGPEAIEELLRVARPGARFAIGINGAHYDELGFAAAIDALVADGTITGFETVDALIYGGTDGSDPDQVSKVAVFELR